MVLPVVMEKLLTMLLEFLLWLDVDVTEVWASLLTEGLRLPHAERWAS